MMISIFYIFCYLPAVFLPDRCGMFTLEVSQLNRHLCCSARRPRWSCWERINELPSSLVVFFANCFLGLVYLISGWRLRLLSLTTTFFIPPYSSLGHWLWSLPKTFGQLETLEVYESQYMTSLRKDFQTSNWTRGVAFFIPIFACSLQLHLQSQEPSAKNGP